MNENFIELFRYAMKLYHHNIISLKEYFELIDRIIKEGSEKHGN